MITVLEARNDGVFLYLHDEFMLKKYYEGGMVESFTNLNVHNSEI